MRKTIVSLCDGLESKVISMRRAFHRIPEPSFGEHKTQAKICSYLKQAGIAFERVGGTTGVLGLIKGSAGPTIALRSDMDALNLNEATGLAFASRNKGYMHACGHDAHMAMMIGAGMVLKRLGRDLPGQVRLIFQPAEETPPGGALDLIRYGALSKPKVSAIIGTHVIASVPGGKVAFNTGTISAAADDFTVTITGKGGHASKPQECIDPIIVATEFISGLQTIVSRRVSPLDSVVITIGRISGGAKHNIIADTVTMDGTVRTRRASLRRRVPAMIRQMLKTTCSVYGAKGSVWFEHGYPPVVCDDKLGGLVRKACMDVLGKRQVMTTQELEMGGEDFAYYAQKVPGVIIFVGISNKKKGKVFQLHHSRFDIDEHALKTGVTAIAYSAYRYLAESKDARRARRK